MTTTTPIPRSYPMAKPGAGLKILMAALLVGSYHLGAATGASGDEFGRLEGLPFFDLPGRTDVHAHTQLTIRELEALPPVLRDERTALVIVKTDSGNLAKLLLSPAFRKRSPSEKDGPSVPVLVLERFETLDAGDRRSFKARGKEMTLFDGFLFDLDASQVVPPGMGGDIVFLAGAPDGPRIAAVSGSQLYTLEKPPATPAPAPAPGKPSEGRAIVPGDFAGRFHLMANGQWSGSLALAVDKTGTVTGHFRSDKNGTAYPVTGQVAADIPQKLALSVQFPRARQVYEGYLWTEGKNAIAGSLSMLDHPYSFIAVREGASLGADPVELTPALAAPLAAGCRVVTVEAEPDRYALDGQAHSAAELSEILTKAMKAEPTTAVLLRVSEDVPLARVRQAAEAIRAAGINRVQLALAAGKGD